MSNSQGLSSETRRTGDHSTRMIPPRSGRCDRSDFIGKLSSPSSPGRQDLRREAEHHYRTPHRTNGGCLLGQAMKAGNHPNSGRQIGQATNKPTIVAIYPLIKLSLKVPVSRLDASIYLTAANISRTARFSLHLRHLGVHEHHVES